MQLVDTPANPVPEGAVTGMLKTEDGRSLRFARWPAPVKRKGTVCLFQGRSEFIEKYFEVVRDLRSRGFAVATLDWRGQGLSDRILRDPTKGHVADFDEYGRDLEAFVKDVVLPDCPPPLFALAHSMGATVMIRTASLGNRWFDRMVLTAPMIRLANTPYMGYAPNVARFLRYGGMGQNFVPGGSPIPMALAPFIGNPVTSDPVRYARTMSVLEASPGLGVGAPTIGWADAAFRAMADFTEPAYASRIRQPILMMGCGRDVLVSTRAIEDFAIHLRAGAHLVVPGSLHELMIEQDIFRQQFWAAFDAFVPGTPLFK